MVGYWSRDYLSALLLEGKTGQGKISPPRFTRSNKLNFKFSSKSDIGTCSSSNSLASSEEIGIFCSASRYPARAEANALVHFQARNPDLKIFFEALTDGTYRMFEAIQQPVG